MSEREPIHQPESVEDVSPVVATDTELVNQPPVLLSAGEDIVSFIDKQAVAGEHNPPEEKAIVVFEQKSITLTPRQQQAFDLVRGGVTEREAAKQMNTYPTKIRRLVTRINTQLEKSGMPAVAFKEEAAQSISLTQRQQEVLDLARKGMTLREAANELDISPAHTYLLAARLNTQLEKAGKPPVAFKEEIVLTPRQQEVLDLARKGMTLRGAAKELGIAAYRVNEFLGGVNERLEKTGRQAVAFKEEAAQLVTPTERQQQALDLVDKGMTLREAAKQLGVTTYDANTLIQRANERLEKAGRQAVAFKEEAAQLVTPTERQQQALDLADKGMTLRGAAKQLGVSRRTVRGRLERGNERLKGVGKQAVAFKEEIILTSKQERVLAMVNLGMTLREVANRFGNEPNVINKTLRGLNGRLLKVGRLPVAFREESASSLEPEKNVDSITQQGPISEDDSLRLLKSQQETLRLVLVGCTIHEAAQQWGIRTNAVTTRLASLNERLEKAGRPPVAFREEVVLTSKQREVLRIILMEGGSLPEAIEQMGKNSLSISRYLEGLNKRLEKAGIPTVAFREESGDASPSVKIFVPKPYDVVLLSRQEQVLFKALQEGRDNLEDLVANTNLESLRKLSPDQYYILDVLWDMVEDPDSDRSDIPSEVLKGEINQILKVLDISTINQALAIYIVAVKKGIINPYQSIEELFTHNTH